MKFTDDEIEIEPLHETRYWQSFNYTVRGQKLFHERTYARTRPPGQRGPLTPAQSHFILHGPGLDKTEQWLDGVLTQAEARSLAKKHGGRVLEEFYPPEDGPMTYFLAFDDTEKALAFCRTKDFDRLCLTLEKIP